MKLNNPMVMLRDMAEDKLTQTTLALGTAHQSWQQAVTQREQLQGYELEYQQSLRRNMINKGMSMADLVNHQSFILSLNQVVKQHDSHVTRCEQVVSDTKENWISDKQRLNAFETLLTRSEDARLLAESRHEQKLMDEFAQRAGRKRETL